MSERTFGPLPMGARVRLRVDYDEVPAGTLGTITWKHPTHIDGEPTRIGPYRVEFDGFEFKPGDARIGMSDIGWLVDADEIEGI